MKKIKRSILLSIVAIIFFIVIYFLHSIVPVVENILYDLNFSFIQSEAPDSVIIVGVDSESIREIGAFPWSRNILAYLIERIESCSPRAIALDFLFPKRPNDPGNDSLAAVFSRVSNLVIGLRVEAVSDDSKSSLAMVTPEAYRHRFMIFKNQKMLSEQFVYSAGKLDFGDPGLSQYADRAGFLNVSTSRTSQKLRELIHVIRTGNEYYPSFALSAAAAFLKLKPDKFILDGKGIVILGNKKVTLAYETGALKVNFRGKPGTIKTLSALEILKGNLNPELLHGKLVFVGITDAPSMPSDFFITPAGTQFPGVEIWATSTLDILTNSWVKNNILLSLFNVLIILFLFPGCAILFPYERNRVAIFTGLFLTIISISAGFIVFRTTGYYWNSGFHIYAWILLMVWLLIQKYEPTIIETHSLKLDPEVSDETETLPPPDENDFFDTIPSLETAVYVARKISPGISISTPVSDEINNTAEKRVIDYNNSAVSQQEVQQDASVIAEFQKLAGGRIVKSLGSGGMADVYLIWHPRMEVYRAVKVIKPDQPAQWMDRFETEIRIFANLNHPNIVQCYGVGEWYSLPYLEMEYVSGATIEDILNKCNSLTPIETLAIGVLVCRALNYAHHQVVTVYGKRYKGIIHRDLKPANILISKTGQIKLSDFGIARPGAVSLHTVDSGKVIGTLPYLSPEQLEGKALSPSTDLYALGATLYELVTGCRVFPQTEVSTLITAKSKGSFKKLKCSTDLPEAFINTIERSMAVNPEKRFASAKDMGKALEKILYGMIQDKDIFILENLVNRSLKT